MRPKRTCGLCAVVAVLALPGWAYGQEGIGIITQARAMDGGNHPGRCTGLSRDD